MGRGRAGGVTLPAEIRVDAALIAVVAHVAALRPEGGECWCPGLDETEAGYARRLGLLATGPRGGLTVTERGREFIRGACRGARAA